MRYTTRRLGTFVTLLALLGACKQGAIRYNEVTRDYHHTLQNAWDQTIAQLRSMGYDVPDKKMPKSGGTVAFKDGWVSIRKHNYIDGYARVTCKFGALKSYNERQRSEKFLDGLSDRLGHS